MDPRAGTASATWPGWSITPTPESQYTSIAFTERLADAGVGRSVGTVGDAYDNALAESVIGLYKTELISPRGPGAPSTRSSSPPCEYVDWFNHRRLHEDYGDIPPVELEAAYYRQNAGLTEAGQDNQPESPDTPGRFRQAWSFLDHTDQQA